jgi:hypothetical protein
LILELKRGEKTLLRVHLWYLVLAYLVRTDNPLDKSGEKLSELRLNLTETVRMGREADCFGERVIEVPQPLEFTKT